MWPRLWMRKGNEGGTSVAALIRSVTVVAGEAVVSNFTLTPTAIALEEIVVTGTGRAFQKKQLGNTVATIDATRLGNAPMTSFSELLQSRAPGVVVCASDGATGSGARIRICGRNSLAMSNEPVVYIDGMRVDNSRWAPAEGGSGRAHRALVLSASAP